MSGVRDGVEEREWVGVRSSRRERDGVTERECDGEGSEMEGKGECRGRGVGGGCDGKAMVG